MQTLDEFSHSSATRSGSGVNVLVVDDETAVRRFAVRVLQREGYEVLEAADGHEALEMIRAGQVTVDLIVSDIVMPRVNGVELMQAVAESHPEVPVVLMSGYATAALSELGIATPCSILPKPFPAERLLAEVHRCMRSRGGGSSAA
ncbi:MAG TPA: response regulator [Gemmatimonadales bacterium]|nr:response regulator [Gemmatimonadales bacterium]